MKTLHFICITLVVGLLLLTRCTPAPPITEEEIRVERVKLDSLFRVIRQDISNARAEEVYHALSLDSKEWFINMRLAARSEPLNFLIYRPFFEILAILSLRIEFRLNPLKSDDPVNILRRTILQVPAIKKNFTVHSLGSFDVSRDRAHIGLQKSPNVPVFYFSKEEGEWKMDLVKTLPLILLGLEGIARNFKNEPIEQAIYVIETLGGRKILPEDLRK